MALGKRKREVAVVKRACATKSALQDHNLQPQPDAHEVFQHYFESQFEPLADLALPNWPQDEQEEHDDQKDESSGASETSEWDGISDAETASGAVEVVKHELVTFGSEDASVDSVEIKTFMVSYTVTHFCTRQI